MRFWLGGYGPDMGGSGSGIGMLLAGAADEASAGGALAFAGDAAACASPSWLAQHPGSASLARGDVVYAALEGAGAVQAFRRTGASTLTPLGAPVAAGDLVCHIAVAPAGDRLVASCWGDGRVVSMRLDAAGRPSAPAIAPAARDPYDHDAHDHHPHDHDPHDPDAPGSGGADAAAVPAGGIDLRSGIDLAAAARALREAAGPEYAHLVPEYEVPDRAAEPRNAGVGEDAEDATSVRVSHAHQALHLPGGLIATTDMGFDLVRFWRAGPEGLRPLHEVVLPKGSGPRHMVWHPSGHLYVVAELSCEVFVLAPEVTGAWRIVGGSPLGAGTLPGDTAAEIALSRDAEFVYAGVRGSDTIAALRVRGTGDVLAPVALVEAGVRWPRHHLVARDILVVAGQLGDEVASLTLDVRSGVPGRVRHRTPAPAPTCLLPVR